MIAGLIEAVRERLLWAILQHTEGGILMMAMFFAQRVILGKTAYKDVPATLRPQVKELLDESGLGDLAVEAAG